jgi:hypothetical protein
LRLTRFVFGGVWHLLCFILNGQFFLCVFCQAFLLKQVA